MNPAWHWHVCGSCGHGWGCEDPAHLEATADTIDLTKIPQARLSVGMCRKCFKVLAEQNA